MGCEVLTEKSCETGNIVERLIKYLVFHRLRPNDMLCILVPKRHRTEFSQHGGKIVHSWDGEDACWLGPYRITFSDNVEDFHVIQGKG